MSDITNIISNVCRGKTTEVFLHGNDRNLAYLPTKVLNDILKNSSTLRKQ